MSAIAERRAARDGDDAATELAPLALVLLRTESASSLEIANVTAMQRAVELADKISVDSILAAHQALLGEHAYAAPDALRDQQVWIGSNALSPHTASSVPPHYTRVPVALNDLIPFVQRVDLPVLVQVTIAHAQFETIHPFNDGNGRIGRTLVHAMLRHCGVTRALTVPVSAGLLTDTSAYFRALTDGREGYLETIDLQFINASFRAIGNGRQLVDDLEKVHEGWSERLASQRGSAARRLLPPLLDWPAVNIVYSKAATGVVVSAAQCAVEQLEDVPRQGVGRISVG